MRLLLKIDILFRSTWKKKFFNREKNREIAFRHKLIDKVRAAEKFDPEVCIIIKIILK